MVLVWITQALFLYVVMFRRDTSKYNNRIFLTSFLIFVKISIVKGKENNTMTKALMKIVNKNMVWEIVGYINLMLCIIGQITVGYWYLFAQFIYLSANIIGIVRNFKLGLPMANKVKDIVFTGITLALIILRFILGE